MSTNIKRVVVTGLGLVTPLGCGVNQVWNALLAGQCGIQKLEGAEYAKMPSRLAARVVGVEANKFVAARELRTMSQASLYALAASVEAVKDSGIAEDDDNLRRATGCAVGMGMSDLHYIVEAAETLKEKGPGKISPYFVPRILTNMVFHRNDRIIVNLYS
jgi:3-oxoacyl-[acyl-carrier-protein] synthase II